jgi:pantetheine-phosphate adenylyltransferase
MPASARIALYPGTFDPVHYGHVDVARRAAQMFDTVVVAVVRDRPAKPLLFSTAERVELFRQAVRDLDNVRVEAYEGLTVAYARTQGAAFIVRGLRGTSDFEYEYQMTTMNRHLAPEVDTVFLMTALKHLYLSSSLIKEVASQGGSLAGLVPDHVATAMRAKFNQTADL